jgi:hypothetical protein
MGNRVLNLGEPGDYSFPAISPDGSRVAVGVGPETNRDIWILDVAGGAARQFTFDHASNDRPAWSPDGKNIAFSSNLGGQFDLYIKPVNGSAEEEPLLKSPEPKFVEHFTRNGFLLFSSVAPKTLRDIWALPFPGAAKPIAALQTTAQESDASVSPNGLWLAYTDSTNVREVFVQPFTPDGRVGAGAKFAISKGGGFHPLWRDDSKELFYTTLSGTMMAVDIDTSKGFYSGTPRRLFNAPPTFLTFSWDVSKDGKRFLFIAPPGGERVTPFVVVTNWEARLQYK